MWLLVAFSSVLWLRIWATFFVSNFLLFESSFRFQSSGETKFDIFFLNSQLPLTFCLLRISRFYSSLTLYEYSCLSGLWDLEEAAVPGHLIRSKRMHMVFGYSVEFRNVYKSSVDTDCVIYTQITALKANFLKIQTTCNDLRNLKICLVFF